jgi:hypothetical protein
VRLDRRPGVGADLVVADAVDVDEVELRQLLLVAGDELRPAGRFRSCV